MPSDIIERTKRWMQWHSRNTPLAGTDILDELIAELEATRVENERLSSMREEAMREIPVEQQLHELRQAVIAMAIALGAGLPQTREVIRGLDALVDTATPECK